MNKSTVTAGRYLFARPTTTGLPTDTARLLSPIVTPSQDANFCLSFWYYLSGIRPSKNHPPFNPNSFLVRASLKPFVLPGILTASLIPFDSTKTQDDEVELAQQSGDQGDRWSRIRVSFYEPKPFRVRSSLLTLFK